MQHVLDKNKFEVNIKYEEICEEEIDIKNENIPEQIIGVMDSQFQQQIDPNIEIKQEVRTNVGFEDDSECKRGSDSNDSGYIEELYIETKYKDVGDEENVSTHIDADPLHVEGTYDQERNSNIKHWNTQTEHVNNLYIPVIHSGQHSYGCGPCQEILARKGVFIKPKNLTEPNEKICKQYCGLSSTTIYFVPNILHSTEKTLNITMGQQTSQNCELSEQKHINKDEKPFKCDECQKTFVTNWTLSIHKRLHTGVKPYHCDECDKSFSQKILLERHKLKLKGKYRFKCEQCTKTFLFKGDLARHERTHSGQKPFQCDVCQKCFTFKHILVTHKQIHLSKKRSRTSRR